MTLAQGKVETRGVLTSGVQETAQRIIVGPNIQVSKALGNNPHAEVYLAADPNNANTLLGGSMVYSSEKNQYSVVAYSSSDGGKTWSPTLTFSDDFYHSDPAAGFGPDGSAYFLQIVTTQPPNNKLNTYFYRANSGTDKWLPPVVLPMYDRHYVTIDDTRSKYHGRLYIAGLTGTLPGLDGVRSPATMSVVRSSDSGATFEPPTQLFASPGLIVSGMAQGVVLSDGTLVVPVAEAQQEVLSSEGGFEGSPTKPNAMLKVITSEDGGETFSKAALISNVAFGHNIISNPVHFGFAVDRSDGPFRDRLYAVWSNTYSGGADIMLSHSSDKGKTWSNPIVVNDDRQPFDPAAGRVHFRPLVAVNRYGVAGVTWNDRRDSSNNLDWSVRFTASLDGGETLLPSVKVSEAPFTHTDDKKFEVRASGYGKGYGPGQGSGPIRLDLKISQFYAAGGHTGGLAADASGTFHPFWVDNRTGVSQVWTATVSVRGHPARNGSAELANLADVTDNVMIVCTNTGYDPITSQASVDVQIQNTSKETIFGPVKARLISLKSQAGGSINILTTDNKENGAGAILDFTSLLTNNELRPGDKSRVKHLEFRISDRPPLEQGIHVTPLTLLGYSVKGWGALQLVSLEARVFGVQKKTQ
jgi:hypothetical protein